MLDVVAIRRPSPMENGRHVTPNVTLQDVRALGFAERAAIADSELVRLADADVPGAETEISLRDALAKHHIKRENVRPHCAPLTRQD